MLDQVYENLFLPIFEFNYLILLYSYLKGINESKNLYLVFLPKLNPSGGSYRILFFISIRCVFTVF